MKCEISQTAIIPVIVWYMFLLYCSCVDYKMDSKAELVKAGNTVLVFSLRASRKIHRDFYLIGALAWPYSQKTIATKHYRLKKEEIKPEENMLDFPC